MRTKSLKQNKINIITLGCSKNLVDSEVLLSQLKGNDLEATHESEKNDANIIVVNTCGFIDNAKQESIDTILSYVSEKEAGKIDKLFVTGCLSHRYKEELETEFLNWPGDILSFYDKASNFFRTTPAENRKNMRGRGRPPKIKTEIVPKVLQVKRGRGRPRK